MTPVKYDPEYAWLREGARIHAPLVGTGMVLTKGVRKTEQAGKITRNEQTRQGPWAVLDRGGSIGILGAFIQVIGLLWLLSVLGFDILWYSVFPLTLVAIGGVFIVRAASVAEWRHREAFHD